MNLLLAPHSDDETLFASYIQLEHKPLVMVCLEGRRARHLVGNDVRLAETAAATKILGCDYRQLPVYCDPPDWPRLEELIARESPEHVWAPLPERDGHPQHNAIGNLAAGLWPTKTTFFATYTLAAGRSTQGERIDEEPGWQDLKKRALACYRSQNSKPDTSAHFQQPLSEYALPAANLNGHGRSLIRLNLGSGPNPIDGFTNLDKQDGWIFEEGLPIYADGVVDAITESHALMYVPLEHWAFVFSEFARVLRPGGVLRMTHDDTADPASSRQGLRHRASVATTPELVLEHMRTAGLVAQPVSPNVSLFWDRSLMQQNYGAPPDVFFVEGTKPS